VKQKVKKRAKIFTIGGIFRVIELLGISIYVPYIIAETTTLEQGAQRNCIFESHIFEGAVYVHKLFALNRMPGTINGKSSYAIQSRDYISTAQCAMYGINFECDLGECVIQGKGREDYSEIWQMIKAEEIVFYYMANNDNAAIIAPREHNILNSSCDLPVYDSNGTRVSEGEPLQFVINAEDPDGDDLTYSVDTNLPNGASFDPNTQEFNWKPNYNQAGSYEVTFTVNDNGEPPLADSETITIEVINKKRPSSYGSYYSYSWNTGGYSQDYQYCQQSRDKQLFSNSQQSLLQLGQAWPNPSSHQQQQSPDKPFDLQSHKLSILQSSSLQQYPYWNFADYRQQQSWNFQKVWAPPLLLLEPYLPNLSWNW